MIRTYLMDVTPLYEEEVYYKYYSQIPDWRKQKAARMVKVAGKAQSVGAWVLFEKVRKLLALGDSPLYNLSHSGNYALCAVSDDNDESIKVGCDIEMLGEIQLNVAKRFFTVAEYENIISYQNPELQNQLFFRYWVLKESFMKATRQGMKLDTRSFQIAFDSRDVPFLCKQPEEFPQQYYYKEYSENGVNAKIAVCTTEANIADTLEVVRLGEML